MSKLTRVTHTIFGGSAPAAANGIAQFGSKQAGTPTYTTDIATLQALAAWLNGWGSAVVSGKVPPLEELNAAFLEPSYQIGYLLEMGIPEYDAGTTYYTNSICQSVGLIYQSLVDSNTGNTPSSSPTKWKILGNNVIQSELAPASFSTNQNNYNPSGWNSGIFNLILSNTAGANVNLTGLNFNVNGQIVNIFNGSSATTDTITIKAFSSSSLAANRFSIPSDIVLAANVTPGVSVGESAMFYYSATVGSWIQMAAKS